jgi:hypothetical protein
VDCRGFLGGGCEAFFFNEVVDSEGVGGCLGRGCGRLCSRSRGRGFAGGERLLVGGRFLRDWFRRGRVVSMLRGRFRRPLRFLFIVLGCLFVCRRFVFLLRWLCPWWWSWLWLIFRPRVIMRPCTRPRRRIPRLKTAVIPSLRNRIRGLTRTLSWPWRSPPIAVLPTVDELLGPVRWMARAGEESLVGRTRTHGRRGATGPEGVVCHERVDEVCKGDVVCVVFMSSAHHFVSDEEFWGCAVSVLHGDQIGARNLCQSRMRAQTSPSTYLSLTTSIFHAIFRQSHTTGRRTSTPPPYLWLR